MPTGRFCAGWKGETVLKWKAKIEILLKQQVLDPQGGAVEKALKTMGYPSVTGVRVGKYIELVLSAEGRGQAAARVEEMSEKLLSNPVIEDYRYELVEVGE